MAKQKARQIRLALVSGIVLLPFASVIAAGPSMDGRGGDLLLWSMAGAIALPAAFVADVAMRFAFGEKTRPQPVFWVVLLAALVLAAIVVAAWLAPINAADPARGAEWANRLLSSKTYQPGRLALILAIAGAAFVALGNSRFADLFGEVRPLVPALALAPALFFATLQVVGPNWAYGNDLLAAGFALSGVIAIGALLCAVFASGAFSRHAFPRGLPASEDGFDRNNRGFMWLYGVATALAASAGSVLFSLSAIWALISFATRRIKPRYLASDRMIILAALGYFAIFALTTFINARPGDDLLAAYVAILPFLGVPFVIPRLRMTPRETLMRWLQFGAVIGLLIALPVAIYESVLAGQAGRRATILSGNPFLLAYVSTVLSVICLLGLERLEPRRRALHVVAALAGVVTVLLTGTLSTAATLPLLLTLVGIRYRQAASAAVRRWNGLPMQRRLAITGLLLIVFAAAAAPVSKRALALMDRIAHDSIEVEGSLAKRLVMWRAGLDAASDAPISGHGVQNRFSAIKPYMTETESRTINFTQLHNGLLTAMVSGGLFGLIATMAVLAAPVLTAWRHARDGMRADTLLLASAVATLYGVAGLFGIMFFNDALDTLFCMMTAVTAALVSRTGPPGGGSARVAD